MKLIKILATPIVLAALIVSGFNSYNTSTLAIANSIVDDSNNYYGVRRARIALAEYDKNVKESTQNCNCGTEIDKYTENIQMPWCAMFVSWVAKEAGNEFLVQQNYNKTWKIKNSQAIKEYLIQFGTYYSREEIKQKGIEPQVGDIIIDKYLMTGTDNGVEGGHAEIVVQVLKNGNIHTVSGNLFDKVNLKLNYNYLESSMFNGFGRPEKNNNG